MPAGFIEPRAWHAGLAGVIAVAGALITDESGAVLIVKQNYRDAWTVPGGICEFGEPPHAGCEREVAEEVGLVRAAGRLLVVDWQPAGPDYGAGARPSAFFLFDGGTLPADTEIALQYEELDEYRFEPPGGLAGLLRPLALRRVNAALGARASGETAYLPLTS
jgi:ADP-ribose pyrophosphatase YjhB (NUDIX family)